MIAQWHSIGAARSAQRASDSIQPLLPTAVGEKAVVTDAHEAIGQDVLQEAADKLVTVELHDFVFVMVTVIFVEKLSGSENNCF